MKKNILQKKLFFIFPSILLGISFLYSWPYFPFVDEIENLYGSFLISKGLLPYRDYFTNHLPGIHILFSLFFIPAKNYLSNYWIHFLCRFSILIFQGLSLKALTDEFFYTISNKGYINKKNNEKKPKADIVFLMFFILLSYLVSPIFMTNLVWSESLLLCFLFLSVVLLLRIVRLNFKKLDLAIFGLLNSIAFLVSSISIPIICCNVVFLFICMIRNSDLKNGPKYRKVATFLFYMFLPILLFAIYFSLTVGLNELYYQAFKINYAHNQICTFNKCGIPGMLFKPLEYILSCLKNFTIAPRKPLILSGDSSDSFLNILLFIGLFGFLSLKGKDKLTVYIITGYLLGLVYASLVRGMAFHVGFAFHFAFCIVILFLYTAIKKGMETKIEIRRLKLILLIPAIVCAIFIYHGAVLNTYLVLGKENFTIKGVGTFNVLSEIDKIYKNLNDPDKKEYRIWIPGFLPGDLYYAELLPADKVYMYFTSFSKDEYFLSHYKSVLERDEVMVLPKLSYPELPEDIERLLKKRIQISQNLLQ